MSAVALRMEPDVSGPDILLIDRSQPFDPQDFDLLKNLKIVDEDERSLKLESIDLAHLRLMPMIAKEGEQVSCADKIKMQREQAYNSLDAKAFQAFWENQDKIPPVEKKANASAEDMVMIAFPGTIFGNPDGDRCFLVLFQYQNVWYYDTYGLNFIWLPNMLAATYKAS